MPSVVRARVVEEIRLRKGTPAAKYLKLVLNVIDGLRFAERTVTSDAMAECSEIGAIIGRPQANESFPGPIEGYDVQASSKGRSTAETKT